ncbi:cation diffusion facilitator family transporter [Novosphingobium cyanobacteriorum]|uniref:Cation diffusion facilitator family transporter n=1 Tax=Novosphingobium cyanobacteriorum TaxID=3024215 RepID=A0ABT6CPF5_9SPHN|nr:cation diffusion facilitator family transporter [Novosphingobium cyanobacteriorum]MDF8335796.1 cation diffusion facilitator family transporter [Novosphingobium cyanobacteriorum]
MAAAHNHGGGEPGDEGHGKAGHDHAGGANARSLIIALSLTGTFLIAELVGAWWFNSLALLSDAAHMFTDAAALAIALTAIKIGQRPADKQRTYGYRRFEILAAAFNAVLLFVVAGYVLYEGAMRFFEPEEVQSVGMFAVASIGLVVNLVAMRVLAGGREASLNVKGAYLEVWADMLGSLGVIGAAIAIYFTNWSWIDPAVAIGIGLWVLPRTWLLLRDTTHILLQGVPRGTDLDAIRAAMSAVPGVAGVHDLHVWSVAGDDASLTSHVVTMPGSDPQAVRAAISAMLEERFTILHSTIQTETEPCSDEQALHA